MERFKIEVSKDAKDWIERFQGNTNDIERERVVIQQVIAFVIDSWINEGLADLEAKEMLTTLRNADCIINSLGE